MNEIILLQDAGKLIDPDTLTDRKWLALGALKRVRIELEEEEAKKQGEHGP